MMRGRGKWQNSPNGTKKVKNKVARFESNIFRMKIGVAGTTCGSVSHVLIMNMKIKNNFQKNTERLKKDMESIVLSKMRDKVKKKRIRSSNTTQVKIMRDNEYIIKQELIHTTRLTF